MILSSRSGRLKMILVLVGLVFVLMPLFYSHYLADKLSSLELKKITLFEKTLVEITNTANLHEGEDVSYELDMLYTIIQDLQLVVINRNQAVDLYNYPEGTDTTRLIQKLKDSGPPPLVSEDYTIYYEYPFTLTLLSYFPIVQFFLLMVYAAIGYAVFNASRREEQNRIWVGMAKETAHQLGTPISGIIGWIEALKAEEKADPETILEMERDVEKLQLVADRFSKIGSKPELVPTDLYPVLANSLSYIKARAPRDVQFQLDPPENPGIKAEINVNLFSWVIENVLRNALDAIGREGSIQIAISLEGPWATLELKDTGKGIPASQWKDIFKPGFTTKKRGWGLGLSLSRRIIENYHRGKIFVKSSEMGKGTNLAIQLPRIS